MSQHARIIEYMELFGSITPMQAFTDIGCTKLSTRIGELEREGYKIGRERVKATNRFGEKCSYMRYWLEED